MLRKVVLTGVFAKLGRQMLSYGWAMSICGSDIALQNSGQQQST